MARAWLAAPLFAALLCAGCVGGPSYDGGPTTEEPHAIVVPGYMVFMQAVDGHPTYSRGAAYVAPGQRQVKVRFEHPIDGEDQYPKEVQTLVLDLADGGTYFLERVESEFPPYELRVIERRRQE